jgi:hypothetical protein
MRASFFAAAPTMAIHDIARRERYHFRIEGRMDPQSVEDVAEISVRRLPPKSGAHALNPPFSIASGRASRV